MQIEIWDRKTNNDETVTMVTIDGRRTQHANHEAAFEYLEGCVRELRAAIATAIVMYLRTPNPVVRGVTESRTSPPRCSVDAKAS